MTTIRYEDAIKSPAFTPRYEDFQHALAMGHLDLAMRWHLQNPCFLFSKFGTELIEWVGTRPESLAWVLSVKKFEFSVIKETLISDSNSTAYFGAYAQFHHLLENEDILEIFQRNLPMIHKSKDKHENFCRFLFDTYPCIKKELKERKFLQLCMFGQISDEDEPSSITKSRHVLGATMLLELLGTDSVQRVLNKPNVPVPKPTVEERLKKIEGWLAEKK